MRIIKIVGFLVISFLILSCSKVIEPPKELLITVYNYNGSTPYNSSVSLLSLGRNEWEDLNKIDTTVFGLDLTHKGLYFLKISDSISSCFLPFYNDGFSNMQLSVYLPQIRSRGDLPPEYLSFQRFSFSDSSTTAQKVADLYLKSFQTYMAFNDSLVYYKLNNIKQKYVSDQYEIQEESLLSELSSEKDTIARNMLYINYLQSWPMFGVSKLDSNICRNVLSEIGPASDFWSFNPNLLSIAVYRTGAKDKYQKYIQEAIAKNPDPAVKAELLYNKILDAKKNNDQAAIIGLCRRIKEECPNTYKAKMVDSEFLNISPGKPIPDFTFISMDNPGMAITRTKMLGRIYLIDFWGTWCSPCVSEMPYLHNVFKKYKDKDFDIISVANDEKENVLKFRKEKWPMPWKHIVLGKDKESNDILEKFGVSGFPTTILVSVNGKILACGKDLRGDNLETTIKKYLK